MQRRTVGLNSLCRGVNRTKSLHLYGDSNVTIFPQPWLDGPVGSQRELTRAHLNCPVRNQKGCRAAVTPYSYFKKIFLK